MRIPKKALKVPDISWVTAALPEGFSLGTHKIEDKFSVFKGTQCVAHAWVEGNDVVFDFKPGEEELFILNRSQGVTEQTDPDCGNIVWAVLVPDGEEWTFCGEFPFKESTEAIDNVFVAGRNPGPKAVLVSYRDRSWSLEKGLVALTAWRILDRGLYVLDGLSMHFQISKPVKMYDSK